MTISKLILALTAAAAATFSHATPIAITNAGFEGPVTATFTSGVIDGWVGDTTTGVFRPSYYAPAGAGFIAGVIGSQTVYLNGGSVQQTLTNTLATGTYTLRTRVGNRADGPDGLMYAVELMAGSSVLGSIDWNDFATTYDGWIDTVLTYTSTGSSTDALGIRLSVGASSFQVNFDDVRLDFQAVQNVPEPASLALISIALLGMGALRRR